MIVLIAEKPSVGMELARLTGCRERKDGYMDGGSIAAGPLAGKSCCVTWAIGHLVGIAEDPETAALHWKAQNLPVIPEAFLLKPRGKDGKPDAGYVRQLKVIQSLFSRCEAIINCGDAGREGELIQRYIHQYVILQDPRCDKPVWRMWTSSMTDEALRAGLRDIRPAKEYDPLYEAGRSRNEADWLVGINATEALTLSIKRAFPYERRVFSLGRVQTPILALVCSRYLENKAFKPVPFWTVKLRTEARGVKFTVTSDDRFDAYEKASSLSKRCAVSLLDVVSAETSPKTVKAPLLHDLTSLQQEASKRYGYDPDETLKILQGLYEAKLVTYPRTGSRFISRDVLKTIPGRIGTLSRYSGNPALRMAATRMAQLHTGELNRQSVNDAKVTDHHALLTEKTDPGELSAKEQRIYELVATRVLEAFSAHCECEVYSVKFACADAGFSASSTKTLMPGWKAVRGEHQEQTPGDAKEGEKDDVEPDQQLPPLKAGDKLPVNGVETVEGQTKPKPIYTMNSLMQAIKTAGKDSEDDEIKSAMKDVGIGTPATRGAILKNLMDVRKFIKKEKGEKVVPTETGLEVYHLVKDMAIADVEMTGRWEIALNAIAEGGADAAQFDTLIRTFTGQITRQLLEMPVGDGLQKAAQAENIICPCCGGTVRVWETNAKCSNKDCGLWMNRTVFGKRLSESTIKYFLENGRTGVIKGFMSKSGKTFDARLKRVIVEKDGRRFANAEPSFDDIKKGGASSKTGVIDKRPKKKLRDTK